MVHAAVDALGHLLEPHVTAADLQNREQVETLAETVHEIDRENSKLAHENAAQAAEKHGVRLEVAKHTETKQVFVLLSHRCVVECSFA